MEKNSIYLINDNRIIYCKKKWLNSLENNNFISFGDCISFSNSIVLPFKKFKNYAIIPNGSRR